jgi:hypothetical protein
MKTQTFASIIFLIVDLLFISETAPTFPNSALLYGNISLAAEVGELCLVIGQGC